MPAYTARAGNFRRRLLFQTLAIVQDGTTGAQSRVWTDAFTVWGEVEPLSGKELIVVGATQSDLSHTITVRWRIEFATPVTADSMRILYKSRIFNINSIMNEDERNRVVTILCEEGLTSSGN